MKPSLYILLLIFTCLIGCKNQDIEKSIKYVNMVVNQTVTNPQFGLICSNLGSER